MPLDGREDIAIPFNGSGVYSLPSTTVTPAVTGTTIDSSDFNSFTADLVTAFNTCMTKDGQTTATANHPMGGYKHTNVAASAARTDYARVAELQDCTHSWEATDGGAADAYTITPAPPITAYAAGQQFQFVPANDNTGASTLAVSGLAAKDIKLVDGTDPLAGMIDASGIASVQYDGTNFVLLNPAGVVTKTGTQTLTNKTIQGGCITLGTQITSPSGTELEFTSIPSWVNKIILGLDELSLAGAGSIHVELGDATSYKTAGYRGGYSYILGDGTADASAWSTSIFLGNTGDTADDISGAITFIRIHNNVWAYHGNTFMDDDSTATGHIALTQAGSTEQLVSALTRIKVRSSSPDFDSGGVNILYEG